MQFEITHLARYVYNEPVFLEPHLMKMRPRDDGGQSLDSFLISDGAIFHQAKGAKIFVQPTYFPKGHPKAGKVSPRTMTFLYGAVEIKGSETIYGWIAKEALAPAK